MADSKTPTGKTELIQGLRDDLADSEAENLERKAGAALDALKEELREEMFAHRSEWRALLMRGAWLLAVAAIVTMGSALLLGWNVGGSWALLEHRVEMLEGIAPHH